MNGTPKLLLVDDEKELVEFLVLVFRECQTKTALNADAALALLRQEPFDVMVTDIRMPGSNGLDLIESAKALWPELPIIVITGHYKKMPEATETKVREWILKPFDMATIRAAVTRALATG